MRLKQRRMAAVLALAATPPIAAADAVTDWDKIACDVVAAAKLSTPIGVRTIAIAQTAVYEAVNEITGRYPAPGARSAIGCIGRRGRRRRQSRGADGAACPPRRTAIEAAYQKARGRNRRTAMQRPPASRSGERGGCRCPGPQTPTTAQRLAARAIGPSTSPASTCRRRIPAVPQWPQRKPWLMASAFAVPARRRRPRSTARSGRATTTRSRRSARKTARPGPPEQTEIARFWEATLPSIYHGVVRSVAEQPGREVTRNARLFAAVAQGMDDALIAVFDAKYHYDFWRPITAIRNGDKDGNDATERDAVLDAVHRNADASRVPLRPLHPGGHRRHGPAGRSGR